MQVASLRASIGLVSQEAAIFNDTVRSNVEWFQIANGTYARPSAGAPAKSPQKGASVEGITEYLPVSSTGHLILTGSLLGFHDDKSKVFDIAIQTGAIVAVIIVYWQKLRSTMLGLGNDAKARRFALNVGIAFVPAVVLGLLFGKAIKAHLFTPVVVASTFIIGGFIILWAERRTSTARIHSVDEMTRLDALKVGLVQCVAMTPGRSEEHTSELQSR